MTNSVVCWGCRGQEFRLKLCQPTGILKVVCANKKCRRIRKFNLEYRTEVVR